MYTHNRSLSLNRHCGSVLFISLIILLVMTILGVQGLGTTILEEKMSGNYRDNHIAFEAAEAALQEAENWIVTRTVPPVANSTGSNGVWTEGNFSMYSGDWSSKGLSVTTGISNLSANPRYIIEELFIPLGAEMTSQTALTQKYFYRITARAVGGTNDAEVLLQTTFAKQY